MVLNSTVRANFTPRRAFKLVPDMQFGTVTEPAVDFSLSSGGQRCLLIGLTNGADFLLIDFFQLLSWGLI